MRAFGGRYELRRRGVTPARGKRVLFHDLADALTALRRLVRRPEELQRVRRHVWADDHAVHGLTDGDILVEAARRLVDGRAWLFWVADVALVGREALEAEEPLAPEVPRNDEDDVVYLDVGVEVDLPVIELGPAADVDGPIELVSTMSAAPRDDEGNELSMIGDDAPRPADEPLDEPTLGSELDADHLIDFSARDAHAGSPSRD